MILLQANHPYLRGGFAPMPLCSQPTCDCHIKTSHIIRLAQRRLLALVRGDDIFSFL